MARLRGRLREYETVEEAITAATNYVQELEVTQQGEYCPNVGNIAVIFRLYAEILWFFILNNLYILYYNYNL